MSQRYAKRVQKELKQLQGSPPPGIELVSAEDLGWIIGAEGTLYAGQQFNLRFTYPPMYPMEAPEVIFVGQSIPCHPHIYSNGHICLSILYDSWSPALTATSVCLSLQSMLSSNTTLTRPSDDHVYVSQCHGKSPKDTRWWFHDDKC